MKELFDTLPLSKGAQKIFSLLLAGTTLTGLILMPFRYVDVSYFLSLKIHTILGWIAMFMTLVLTFVRFKEVLGWPYTIIKIPLFLVMVFSYFLPLTGEMIIGWTSFLFLLDWKLTKRKLRKLGYEPEDIKYARSKYLDFAILIQVMLTGFFISAACLSFLLVYHKVHGLTLPFLLLWFGPRHIRKLDLRSRIVAITSLSLFIVILGVLYINKQIIRNDEIDLKYPDVHKTVESQSSRHTLKSLDESLINGSESCSGYGCHTILFNQWRGSSHRYSVNNKFFKKQVALYIEMEGPEYVRTCINCHDPVTAFRLDAEERYAAGDIDNPEGISCKACHIITDYDEKRGNGLYTVKAPSPYPWDGFPEYSTERKRHDWTIHIDPRRHLRNFRRKDLYRGSEYCVTCHLVTVPAEVTGREPLHLHTLFDQWRESDWPEKLNCVDCHLPRFQMDENGYTFFDHRIMGINTDLLLSADVPESEVPYIEDFNYFTERYIAGDLRSGTYEVLADPLTYRYRKNPARDINPMILYTIYEIKRFYSAVDFLSSGPIIDLEVTIQPALTEDGRLQIHAKTTNARVGHNFPSGPIDVQQVWLEVILEDEAGNVIEHIGAMDEDKYVDPEAPILGSRGIMDSGGRRLLHHEFWRAAGVIDKRVLRPHESTEDSLTLALPDKPDGNYTLTVQWNFRRMNQRIVDWVWEGENLTMLVLILDHSKLELYIESGSDNKRKVTVLNVDRPVRGKPEPNR